MVERRTALTALLALVAVLALGVSAATLTTTTTTDSTAGGFGGGSNDDEAGVGGDEQGGVELGGESGQAVTLGLCVAFLRSPEFLAGLGLVGLVTLGALYRTTRSWLLSGMTLFSLSLPIVMVILLLTSCEQGPTEFALSTAQSAANQSSILSSQGGGSPGGGGEGSNLTTPSSLLGIVLLAALVGSVGLLLFSTGDDEEELADEPPEPPEPERRRGVAQAAENAAERLEGDAELENAVYRAWREMTVHLDVEQPRSSTPAEFAAAAVDAGMDREDVTELTELFESVRYGGQEPTAAEERCAVDALRNIAQTYGDESFDTPSLGGDDS